MTENITDGFAAWTSYIQEEYVENSGEDAARGHHLRCTHVQEPFPKKCVYLPLPVCIVFAISVREECLNSIDMS